MQLHLRAGAMRQSAGEDGEHRARGAVDRPLVQEAQRAVHDLRKYALDEDAAAQQEAHQVADGGPFAERHQRTEVAIGVRPQRLAAKAPLDLPDHMRGLLVRGLRARRRSRRWRTRWDRGWSATWARPRAD